MHPAIVRVVPLQSSTSFTGQRQSNKTLHRYFNHISINFIDFLYIIIRLYIFLMTDEVAFDAIKLRFSERKTAEANRRKNER